MAFLSKITDSGAVLKAIAECKKLGDEKFLAQYGFGAPREYYVKYADRLYPSKAVVGVAYGKQYPNEGPLKSTDFSGGKGAAVKCLETLGFEIERR